MKKVLVVVLALAMVFTMFACGDKTPEVKEVNNQFGFGLANPAATIKEATDTADASVQVNPCACALLVDEEGKIVDVLFDAAQSTAKVDANGVVLDKEQAFRTKLEKQGDYNMKGASPIGKEWFEQVAFLQDFLKGKTLADVKAVAIADGYPADAALKAGCTIHVTDFFDSLLKAFENLQPAGNAEKVTLGIITDLLSSTDLTAEKDGQVFFENYYGAAALNAEGKINAVIMDETQIKFPVTEGGVIGESSNYKTKIELKEAYGMQKASGLAQGEWYQQTAFLSSKLVGLDKAGVKAVALDEGGYPTTDDIKAGCTMRINSMLDCLVKGM